MKVVIDFFKLIKGNGKSIGIYNVGYNVIVNLATLYKETDIELYVICNSMNKIDFDGVDVKLIEVTQLNPENKLHCLYWELFAVNKWLNELKADVVLFPRGFIPIYCKTKSIAIIHDMIPFYYNEHYHGYFNIFENYYIMSRLKYSAKNANKVITVSNYSKDEIVRYTMVDESKVQVIYNGIEQIDIADIKRVDGDYICAITSRLPHKNAIGILKSYEEYCKLVGEPLNIIIIGIEEQDIAYCKKLSKDVLKRIRFIKYIDSNKELYSIIKSSKVFVFLSMVEGFGLPPIEAMQLGTPVICSNRSSLSEVVGDAAVLVDPDDYNSIARMIEKCSNDRDFSTTLVNKGLINTKRFVWGIQAKKYLNEICKTAEFKVKDVNEV